MTIALQCDECGKGYKVRDAASGRRVRCKNCGQSIRVPARQALPPAVLRRKKSQSKLGKDDGKPNQRAPRRRSRLTALNGLRFVLAGLLLSVAAFLINLLPLAPPVGSTLRWAAALLTLTGQAMCLTAPRKSNTQWLVAGAIGLHVVSLVGRLPGVGLGAMGFLAWTASFFLFVFALKKLAAFAGSAAGEMHAEQILYWGAGFFIVPLVLLRLGARLGSGLVGPLSLLLPLATMVVGVMIVVRYIDLLGCLKESLSDA
jgi:predicted Zn finger-like uncharacterized protein